MQTHEAIHVSEFMLEAGRESLIAERAVTCL